MYRDSNRDRDDNGVPDWQENENYLDEAPPGAPVGTGGCLLSLLSLATAATVLGRLARACRLPFARLPDRPRRAAVAAHLVDVHRLAHRPHGGSLP
jgi:hypothetical protein